MRRRIALTAIAPLAALNLAACNCGEVKPGTVETVNHYCVIQNDDPVDPAIVRMHDGDKVGFCCKGCLKTWDAMSDAQKDKAIRVAVAKGKPQ